MLGGIRDSLVYGDRSNRLTEEATEGDASVSESKLPSSKGGTRPKSESQVLEAEERSRSRLNVKNKLNALDRLWYQSTLPALGRFESCVHDAKSSNSGGELAAVVVALQRELWMNISSVHSALLFVVRGMQVCADEVIIQNANLIRSMLETFLQRKGLNTPYFLLSPCVPLCLEYMNYWSERTPLYYKMYKNHAKWTVSNFYQTFNQMAMQCTYLLEHIRAGQLAGDLKRMQELSTNIDVTAEDSNSAALRASLQDLVEHRTACTSFALLLHVLNNVPYLTAVDSVNIAGIEDDGNIGMCDAFDSGKFGFMTDSDAAAQRNRVWRLIFYVISVDSALRRMILSDYVFAVELFRETVNYLALALNQAGSAQVLVQFSISIVNLWSANVPVSIGNVLAPSLRHLTSIMSFFEVTLSHYFLFLSQDLAPEAVAAEIDQNEFTPSFTNTEGKHHGESLVEDLCNVIASRFDTGVTLLKQQPDVVERLRQSLLVPCFAYAGIHRSLFVHLQGSSGGQLIAVAAGIKRLSLYLHGLATRQMAMLLRFAQHSKKGFCNAVFEERERRMEANYLLASVGKNMGTNKTDKKKARFYTSLASLLVSYEGSFKDLADEFTQHFASAALILVTNVWCAALDIIPMLSPLIGLLQDSNSLSERSMRRIEWDFNGRMRGMRHKPELKTLPAITRLLTKLFKFVDDSMVRLYVVFRIYLHNRLQACNLHKLEKLVQKLKDPIITSSIVSITPGAADEQKLNRGRYAFRYDGIVRLTYVGSALIFTAVASELLQLPGTEKSVLALCALSFVSHAGTQLPNDQIAARVYQATSAQRESDGTQDLIRHLAAAACDGSRDYELLPNVSPSNVEAIEESIQANRDVEETPAHSDASTWLRQVNLERSKRPQAVIETPQLDYDISDWIVLKTQSGLLRHMAVLAPLCKDFGCLVQCISLGLRFVLAPLQSMNTAAHLLLANCITRLHLHFPSRKIFMEQVSNFYLGLLLQHVGGNVAFSALTRMLSFMLSSKGAHDPVWGVLLGQFLKAIDSYRMPSDARKMHSLVGLYFQVLQAVDFHFMERAAGDLRRLVLRREDLQEPILQAAFKSISQRSDLYRKDWCVAWYEKLCAELNL